MSEPCSSKPDKRSFSSLADARFGKVRMKKLEDKGRFTSQGNGTMNPELARSSEQDEDNMNMWNIVSRRQQQLLNRRHFLQEVQKKNNRIEGYLANEDGPSELEKIEEELKLLEEKEKDLILTKSHCTATQSKESDPIHVPIQGLYILPVSQTEAIYPILAPPQDKTVSQTEAINPVGQTENSQAASSQQEELKETLVSLDDLSMSPARVRCPSCDQTVTTQIRYKLSSNAFLFCGLLSVLGCVAGCCLIPFCLDRFKDVSHSCPSCHKEICAVCRI